jgi:hypothetical protein
LLAPFASIGENPALTYKGGSAVETERDVREVEVHGSIRARAAFPQQKVTQEGSNSRQAGLSTGFTHLWK